jgi:hypothetical protein
MTVNTFHYWPTRGSTRCICTKLRTMVWDGEVGDSALAGAKSPLACSLDLLGEKFCGGGPFI